MPLNQHEANIAPNTYLLLSAFLVGCGMLSRPDRLDAIPASLAEAWELIGRVDVSDLAAGALEAEQPHPSF